LAKHEASANCAGVRCAGARRRGRRFPYAGTAGTRSTDGSAPDQVQGLCSQPASRGHAQRQYI